MMGKVLFMRKGETHMAPSAGILASDLAVGSVVKLMENGVATEYLVVNQGVPSASRYDSSCNGTWLLMKDIYAVMEWDASNLNDYESSDIHQYLNGDFYNTFGEIEKNVIKQVKIPYRPGSGTSTTVNNGENGLSTKIFLLSGFEVGFARYSNLGYPVDGWACSYFTVDTSSTGAPENSSRIAYYNGSEWYWWTRSPYLNSSSSYVCAIYKDGHRDHQAANASTFGIRPALILPSNALFDTNTLILKGVA